MAYRDKDELKRAVNSLEGVTIGQVASAKNLAILQEQWRMVQSGERKYMEKQVINDIIEQDYFNVPKNSSEDPDLILDDGDMFELKVSHLFKSRGLIRPKYRLVLKVLNYEDMAEHENWENSALHKKLKQMVIVFYYKDEEKSPWDWVITTSFIWLSADFNSKIQSDYTLTRDRVLAGLKISESDTNLLANCPKHNSKFCWWCHIGDECTNPKKKHPAPHPVLDGALRKHPAMGMAEKRGYCIPAQYMAVIFSNQIRMPLEKRGSGGRPSYGVPVENVPYL